MSKFVVPIHYSGVSNFIVEAKTKQGAIDAAKERYLNGETPEALSNESEDITSIGDIEKLPVVKAKRYKTGCKFCGKGSCYAHCSCSKEGEHEPAMSTLRPADGAEGIVDVNCRLCGLSGSCRINPKDIVFE